MMGLLLYMESTVSMYLNNFVESFFFFSKYCSYNLVQVSTCEFSYVG
jgi:hypothetical protein